MSTSAVQVAARHIGEFYLTKSGDREKAVNAIKDLGFTKLEIAEETNSHGERSIIISIHCACVGMLIGARGKNLDSLTAYLSGAYNCKVGIKLYEDDLLWSLMPPEPDYPLDYDDWDYELNYKFPDDDEEGDRQ